MYFRLKTFNYFCFEKYISSWLFFFIVVFTIESYILLSKILIMLKYGDLIQLYYTDKNANIHNFSVDGVFQNEISLQSDK